MTLHTSIAFNVSPGLQTEIDHLNSETCVVYDSLEKLREYTENGIHAAAAAELHQRLEKKSQVLDVGCGFGETSLLLGAYGHTVHSVEPAENRCRAVQASFAHLKLDGHAYVCTGEDLDRAPLPPIDGALFYSSLHHCDDPLRALRNVRSAMTQRGVVVINEPVLRFYRTKKWYYRKLQEDPVKMGHYGGNEHIYYFNEYHDLLTQAGFDSIEFYWSHRTVDPRKTLTRDLASVMQGKHQYSVLRCIVKYAVHSLIKKACRCRLLTKLLIRPLLKLSLLQASFAGYASP
jgi:SAM-dependent methyltransferase